MSPHPLYTPGVYKKNMDKSLYTPGVYEGIF